MSIGPLIFRALSCVSLLALTPAAACAQIATPKVAQIQSAAAEVSFELYRGSRIFLQGQVNGVTTPMILDSGAGVTTIDTDFARRIGLKKGQKVTAQGTGGRQQAELVQDVTLEVGSLRLSGVTVAVIDLDMVEKAIGRPMPVILGRELFMNSVVQLDFERHVLALAPVAGFVAPPGASEVRLERDGTLHYLPISIAGLPAVEAALDLGNGGSLSLSKELVDAKPAIAALPQATGFGGGVGGLHEIKRATLPALRIGGFRFDNVPADLGTKPKGPYARKANAGIQLFKPFRLTLDLSNDRLWLERSNSPATFSKDRGGVFAMLEGDHFNVLHVSPASPAEKAGLRAGDKIVAIAGVPIGPGFYTSAEADWAKGPAGTIVVLTKAGGEQVAVTLGDYY